MKRLECFVKKNGNLIVALVAMVASVAVNGCKGQWYQPLEPEGLKEFGEKFKSGKYETFCPHSFRSLLRFFRDCSEQGRQAATF